MGGTRIGGAVVLRRDPRAAVVAAAWYVQEVRAGHVVMTSPGEVAAALCGHLEALLRVIDEQYLAVPEPTAEQARRRDAILAELPAGQRVEGADIDCATAAAVTLARLPGDTAVIVTRWLQAVKTGATQTPAP